jgi:hypothetical protein
MQATRSIAAALACIGKFARERGLGSSTTWRFHPKTVL